MTVASRLQGTALAAAMGALTIAAVAPATTLAGGCGIGNGRGLGYTYVTSLTVQGVSCADGRALVRHHGKLRGWRCSGHTLDSSPFQYDVRESCASGRRRVNYTYTQNR